MLFLESNNGFIRTCLKHGDRILFYRKTGLLKITRGARCLLFSKDQFDNEIYHPSLKDYAHYKFIAELIAETNGLRAIDVTASHSANIDIEVFCMQNAVRKNYKRYLFDFFKDAKTV